MFIFFIRYIDIPVKNSLFRNQKHKNTKSLPYRPPWRCCRSGTVVSYRLKVPLFHRIFMVCIYMHVQYQCNFLFTVLFTNRFFRRIAFWTIFDAYGLIPPVSFESRATVDTLAIPSYTKNIFSPGVTLKNTPFLRNMRYFFAYGLNKAGYFNPCTSVNSFISKIFSANFFR